MAEPCLRLWAPRAWLGDSAGGRWAESVLLEAGTDGRWVRVVPGVRPAPPGAEVLQGTLLPGMVNAHSHAFQRAFAGLAERREGEHDDFWSWRERMYGVAARITPQTLRAVAEQLFAELLGAGYTHVCEFHYLHLDEQGLAHADPHALAWALADAAQAAGIGLTLMPVLYERAGFAAPALRPGQRRFARSVTEVLREAGRIASAGRPLLRAGLAIHSLRAARPGAVHALAQAARGFDGPVHIHVAEQAAEVDDCLAATGRRPIQWLAEERLLGPRWQLVHATHAEQAEIEAVAASGAGIVLCPSTEANLGDGLCALPGWLAAGVPLTLGSDSHVTRDWREELRLLEYGQRLQRRQRNVAADPRHRASSAERLLACLQPGAAAATGEPCWGLQAGARADAQLFADADPALAGVPAACWLDPLIFTSPCAPPARVMVAARWCAGLGAADAMRRARAFATAMEQLHGTG